MPPAFADHAAHLQPMELPQPKDPFLVDVLLPIDQDVDPTIAVAQVLAGQILNLAQQRRIVGLLRDVTEGRAGGVSFWVVPLIYKLLGGSLPMPLLAFVDQALALPILFILILIIDARWAKRSAVAATCFRDFWSRGALWEQA
jgi:hypothetical protein